MTQLTSFGEWVSKRRRALDLTQAALAQQVGCSIIAIKKIEADERRPSTQIAELLATALQVAATEQALFVRAARGLQAVDCLPSPHLMPVTAAVSAPANHQPTPSPPPLPHNLPAQLTPLLGRQVELAELARLLLTPTVRLLTILGPGGIGKTHLLLAAAQQLCHSSTLQRDDYFPDGVWWVALAAVPTAERMVEVLAAALALKLNNYQEPAQQLHQWLRPKKLLLLLDNMEHLTEGVDLLVDLLRTASHLKIVTTSRVRLQLQGEQLLPLDGLSYPHGLSSVQGHLPPGASPDWARYAAIQLFMQQAQRTDPGFVCQGDEAQAVAAICRTLQGMPLAILLAAGWVTTMPVVALAEQLQSSLDFLAHEWRDLPPRQQSMRAVLDQSWRLLREREQEILQAASFFRAGFTHEAAWAVMGASLPDLATLVEKSLLQRHPNGRYVMHELLRQYGAERLEKSADQGAGIRWRYTKYFVELLSSVESGGDFPEKTKMVLPDLENVHLAWQFVLQQREFTWVVQARTVYIYLLSMCTSSQYLHEILRQFSGYLENLLQEQPLLYRAQRMLAWTFVGLATSAGNSGQYKEMDKFFRRSIEIFQGPAYSPEESLAQCAMAWVEEGRVTVHSRPLHARQLYEQALPVLQKVSNHNWFIGAHIMLANLNYHLGQYQEAEHALRHLIDYHKQVNIPEDPHNPAIYQKLIGLSIARQGQFHNAEILMREALLISERQSLTSSIGEVLAYLGIIVFWRGKEHEAQTLITRKLTHYVEAGVPGQTPEAQRTQAIIFLHAAAYEQAAHYCLQAIETQRLVRDSFALGESLVILGQIRLGEERWADAEAALTECITLYQSLGEHGVIGSAYATLAYLRLHQGNAAEARQQVRNALQIAQEWRAFFAALYALPALALLKLAAGETEQAVALYALVTAQTPVVARSQWFAQMVGRKLAARQTTLSPDLVASAQKKGEATDLWEAVEQLHSELQVEFIERIDPT